MNMQPQIVRFTRLPHAYGHDKSKTRREKPVKPKKLLRIPGFCTGSALHFPSSLVQYNVTMGFLRLQPMSNLPGHFDALADGIFVSGASKRFAKAPITRKSYFLFAFITINTLFSVCIH